MVRTEVDRIDRLRAHIAEWDSLNLDFSRRRNICIDVA